MIIKTFCSVFSLAFYLHGMCTPSALSWPHGLLAIPLRTGSHGGAEFLFLRQNFLVPVTVHTMCMHR